MSQISLSDTLNTLNTLNASTLTSHNHIKNKRRLNLLKFKEIIIPSSTNLKINLIEPILFMRGISEESAGCFLRGELIVNLSKPTKIKKIEMKFTGKMKTFWPEGKIYHGSYSNNNNLCEVQKIFSHTWNFLTENNFENSNNSSRLSQRFSSTSFHTLPSGTLSYPFELFVPGYLPETIEAERGEVTYKLVASVIKQGLSPNTSVTRYIPIIRTLLDEEILEGIVLSKNWNHCLNYDINIPKKAYSLGDSIDIDLKLTPLVKNLRIINVKIKLSQEAIYEEGTQKYEEVKRLNSLQLEDYGEKRLLFSTNKTSLDTNPNTNINTNNTNNTNINTGTEENNFYYQKYFKFPIPKCTSSSVHHSCKSPSIHISHQLKFTLTINEPPELSTNKILKIKKNHVKVKFDVPIKLLSCRCSIVDELPIYEENDYNNNNTRLDNLIRDSVIGRSSNNNNSNNFGCENLDIIESPPNYEFEF